MTASRTVDAMPLEPINDPYLLVTGIPCYLESNGRRWTDALWYKDLVEHLAYLKKFTLASPVRRTAPPPGARCLSDDSRFASTDYVDLPASDSELAGLLNWPRTFALLWRAAGKAHFVHAGVADWPIPTGWAATIAAKLRRRILLINIESAFWRVPPSASAAKRVRARIWEAANRWCVRQATLPLFTQREYARQMLPCADRGYVFQASWIDDGDVLDESAACRNWDEKESRQPLSVLFAGRLITDKGVADLLHALEDETLPARVDFVGTGPLAEDVRTAAQRGERVRLLDPVPYGPAFFALLRTYHAVIIPSISDEQPRIAYDAYSQAVPVLATRTAGLLECVRDSQTGLLVEPGSVSSLRDMLRRANRDRKELRQMGLQALEYAKNYTHREMHRRRWQLLTKFRSPLP